MNWFGETITFRFQIDWMQVSQQLVVSFAHFLWQGTILGITLWIVLRLFHDRPSKNGICQSMAAWRYGATCIAMGFLPICVLVTFLLTARSNDEVAQKSRRLAFENATQTARPLESDTPNEFQSSVVENRLDAAINSTQASPAGARLDGHAFTRGCPICC